MYRNFKAAEGLFNLIKYVSIFILYITNNIEFIDIKLAYLTGLPLWYTMYYCITYFKSKENILVITTTKITSKGQVTIPKEIREVLNTDVVEFKLVKGNVIIKPVMSVGGSLQKYAKKYHSLKDTRDSVWKNVVNDKTRKNTH